MLRPSSARQACRPAEGRRYADSDLLCIRSLYDTLPPVIRPVWPTRLIASLLMSWKPLGRRAEQTLSSRVCQPRRSSWVISRRSGGGLFLTPGPPASNATETSRRESMGPGARVRKDADCVEEAAGRVLVRAKADPQHAYRSQVNQPACCPAAVVHHRLVDRACAMTQKILVETATACDPQLISAADWLPGAARSYEGC